MTTVSPISTTGTTSSAVSTALDKTEIASNFTTFLQLLTTQLKNQNPLDPLDTNQFTQQLVQFAQVEQQMKSNDQLSSLVSLEKSAQASTALAYVGATVVVDGSTAALSNGNAAVAFRPVLEFEAQRARELYRSAEALMPLIDDDSQPALWVLVTIYRRLLEKISDRKYDVFGKKISLTVREKVIILGKGLVKRLA